MKLTESGKRLSVVRHDHVTLLSVAFLYLHGNKHNFTVWECSMSGSTSLSSMGFAGGGDYDAAFAVIYLR